MKIRNRTILFTALLLPGILCSSQAQSSEKYLLLEFSWHDLDIMEIEDIVKLVTQLTVIYERY